MSGSTSHNVEAKEEQSVGFQIILSMSKGTYMCIHFTCLLGGKGEIAMGNTREVVLTVRSQEVPIHPPGIYSIYTSPVAERHIQDKGPTVTHLIHSSGLYLSPTDQLKFLLLKIGSLEGHATPALSQAAT